MNISNAIFYMNITKYNFFFTLIVIVLLFIDVGQFFLVGTAAVPFLLCIYCLLLFYTKRYILFAVLILAQCLESFCCFNFFFFPWIYIIPVSLFAFIVKKNLYPSLFYIVITALIGIIIKIYIIEAYFLHVFITNYHAMIKICFTLFTVTCFYLIINIWNKHDYYL